MRGRTVAAAVAAIMLAGCGSGGSGDSPQVSEAKVKDRLADAAHSMRPGEYRSSVEVTRFDVPGMPEEQAAMMRQMMTSATAVEQSYCMTEEDVARGSEDMFRELAENDGDCSFERFDLSGGRLAARMVCRGEGGEGASTVEMDGTMGADSSTVRMVATLADPNMPQGSATMETRVTSRRTGDCTAESRAAAEERHRAAGN